jgi:hypothetical protein
LTAVVSLAVVLTCAGVRAVDAQQAITVPLAPPPEGGRAYTATLTDAQGGRTRVEIRIDQVVRDAHTPAGDFTARVQAGTCAAPDQARALPLANVREGYSLTEVDVAFAELAAAPHVIVIDRGPDDPKGPYLACGAIPSSGLASAAEPPADAAAGQAARLDGAVVLAGAVLVAAGVTLALIKARPGRQHRRDNDKKTYKKTL